MVDSLSPHLHSENFPGGRDQELYMGFHVVMVKYSRVFYNHFVIEADDRVGVSV